MVAPVELGRSATGHEMSNQGEYQILPNTYLDPLGNTGGYLQLRSFTFLHNFRPWWLVAAPHLVVLSDMFLV